jgi:hypothetical protein
VHITSLPCLRGQEIISPKIVIRGSICAANYLDIILVVDNVIGNQNQF